MRRIGGACTIGGVDRDRRGVYDRRVADHDSRGVYDRRGV